MSRQRSCRCTVSWSNQHLPRHHWTHPSPQTAPSCHLPLRVSFRGRNPRLTPQRRVRPRRPPGSLGCPAWAAPNLALRLIWRPSLSWCQRLPSLLPAPQTSSVSFGHFRYLTWYVFPVLFWFSHCLSDAALIPHACFCIVACSAPFFGMPRGSFL